MAAILTIVSLFWINVFKTSDQEDSNRLDKAQSMHILEVQFPFFSSPNATDSGVTLQMAYPCITHHKIRKWIGGRQSGLDDVASGT